MNEVQKQAMKIEEQPFPKPGDQNQGAMMNEAMKANQRKILHIISEGLGAIRNGTYSGHDAYAIAEIQQFLKNVTKDLQDQIKDKTVPSAEFQPQPKPEVPEPAGAS
ncbi:MAG: hypothetical protein KGL39_19990 [Patescibacteria group bacterium]|nr:hypothetical protein [Patescibacteria group bacterium]